MELRYIWFHQGLEIQKSFTCGLSVSVKSMKAGKNNIVKKEREVCCLQLVSITST